jgi:transcriptional regulator with XRE-family HTH domain
MTCNDLLSVGHCTHQTEVKFFEAFRETMHRFNLSGSDLAESSGVSMSQISRFRGGQNVRVETVEQLLAAMPQEAREYMLALVAKINPEVAPLPPRSEGADQP